MKFIIGFFQRLFPWLFKAAEEKKYQTKIPHISDSREKSTTQNILNNRPSTPDSDISEPADIDYQNLKIDQWKPTRMEDIDSSFMNLMISGISSLPDLPVSVYKLITMVDDPNTNFQKITEIAVSDPVLVSNILKIVNSAYYSLVEKIDNLNRAITMLGFIEIKRIAIQCSLSTALMSKEINTQALWRHSNAVSICARELAKDKIDPDYAGVLMTLGLLHDIGKFAVHLVALQAKSIGIEIPEQNDLPPNTFLLWQEETVYGANHAVVGVILAKKWNLPKRICKVIEYHHYPSFFSIDTIHEHYRKDVAFISIADYIIHTLSHSKNINPKPDLSYFEIADLPSDLDNLIVSPLKKKIKEFLPGVENLT